MRWNSVRKNSPTEWHRWFAWHPVKIEHKWVWLEYVYRKVDRTSYGAEYEYRFGG